jgi:hypothetical protein
MIRGKGDRIVVESEKVGTSSREGEILETRETEAGTRYRVRWDDGRETSFLPASGSARIVPGLTKSVSSPKRAKAGSKK